MSTAAERMEARWPEGWEPRPLTESTDPKWCRPCRGTGSVPDTDENGWDTCEVCDGTGLKPTPVSGPIPYRQDLPEVIAAVQAEAERVRYTPKSRAQEVDEALAAVGLPQGSSLETLIQHHRANAASVAAFDMLAKPAVAERMEAVYSEVFDSGLGDEAAVEAAMQVWRDAR